MINNKRAANAPKRLSARSLWLNPSVWIYVTDYRLQITDYDSKDIEKISLYARDLQPMLRERLNDNEVYFSNIIMSHYRFSKLRQQDLKLQ